MKARPRLLWVTDPWATLDHPKDTTLRLIEECVALGVPAWWCDLRSIRFQEGVVLLDAQPVQGVYPGRRAQDFKLGPSQRLPPGHFTQIHYRTDPPVDLAYLHPLQLLQLATQGSRRTRIVNPPAALFMANEKLAAARLGALMPPSVVSSQLEPLESFGREQAVAVLKPLHEAQSHGVERLEFASESQREQSRERLRLATLDQSRPVILQAFLPGIAQGEQRLWFLDGELLACARKRPREGTFRIDMDQGGTLVRTELTAREQRAARQIGRLLRRDGIRLAAIDLIDGYVTDFNFTSPGLIVGMEQLLGRNLARPIVEALVASHTTKALIARLRRR
jgi:glutathione synthase